MGRAMTRLKKTIPALASGLLLAGCGDGAGQASLVPEELDESIRSFCMKREQCEPRYYADRCIASTQAFVRQLVVQEGVDDHCLEAFGTYYDCQAKLDCEDRYVTQDSNGSRQGSVSIRPACDTESYAIDEACGFE